MPHSAQPELVLYYHPHSFYSQKVLMTLFEKRIQFQTRFVNIMNGKQFTDEFLALNPRGEVPVLVDDNIRHIPDSSHIIEYLEDNFSNGYPKLRPDEADLRNRCDTLNQQISALKVECLSFGTGIYSAKDLGINPKPPYSLENKRSKMRDVVENRKRILRTEAKKFPQYSEALNQKLKDVERDLPLITNREKYEGLIISFEKVLDECEAELASHDDKNWWLVSPNLTVADVSLSILLYRLWELGFEKRMWERTRPAVDRYFNRVRKLESFKKATSMTEGMSYKDILNNPNTWYILGALAVLGGGYYLYSKGIGGGYPYIPFIGFFTGADRECPVHGAPAPVKSIKPVASPPSTPKYYSYPASSGTGADAASCKVPLVPSTRYPEPQPKCA